MLYTGLFDSLGEEPAGPVVVVLTARLEVEVGQAPVLQLLAEVLHAHLHHTVSTAGATLGSPVGQYYETNRRSNLYTVSVIVCHTSRTIIFGCPRRITLGLMTAIMAFRIIQKPEFLLENLLSSCHISYIVVKKLWTLKQ